MPRSFSTGVEVLRVEHSGIIPVDFVAVVNYLISTASSQDTTKRKVGLSSDMQFTPASICSLPSDDTSVIIILSLY
jgi:hypothetical protein